MKAKVALMALIALSGQFLSGQGLTAMAAMPGSVVINEIAWAGSADSSRDEWIELYNTSNVDIDLSGWSILDDGAAVYEISEGVIPARGFFLIADSEGAISNMNVDAVIRLSLANTGDSLVLRDNLENVIDTVNGTGGAWYAGSNNSKATMERIDPFVLVDNRDNWASANVDNIGLASGGSPIVGTPGAVNSNFNGEMAEVAMEMPLQSAVGENIEVKVTVNELEDLYAYGLELNYDSNFLRYLRTEDQGKLGLDGEEVFFDAALENGEAGRLIIGASRLTNPESGIEVDGNIVSVFFEVIGGDGGVAELSFGADSFIADSQGDIAARISGSSINIGEGGGAGVVGEVVNLRAEAGDERYTVKLLWAAPIGGADEYIIRKAGPDNLFREIGRSAETVFIDDGELVVNVEYSYQVIAVLNGQTSDSVETTGSENRGIAGDIDRSDRVDGRDIEQLARSYGKALGENGYMPSKDLNYDGMIDGNDLITIGANFGLTF